MKRHFPNLTRLELIELCCNIANKIWQLHKSGIIIGDINGSNILVSSPSKVYFVDTDSYQINDYPCPVGTEAFTAPEIQNKDCNTFLRTKGNENFAIATLFFRLLLFGQYPYAHQGGETIGHNIRTGEFSFPFQNNSNHKIPEGDWRYYWSHLFFPLKKEFFQTFRKDQIHYEESKRPDIYRWKNLLNDYSKHLSSGKLNEMDPEANVLFPKDYKKDPAKEYEICAICGKSIIKDQLIEGYCKNCLNKKVAVPCKRCSGDIIYTNYRVLIRKIAPPSLCTRCRNEIAQEKELARIAKEEQQQRRAEARERKRQEIEYRNQVYSTETCIACGSDFDITNGEYDYLVNKGFSLPKRCKYCRDNNIFPERREYTSYPRTNNNSASSGNSNSDDGCFVTTAVCEHLGKADDCYELTMLRYFRDSWLAKQSDGRELIQIYYKHAPSIVDAMKVSNDFSKECDIILENCILPCVRLIEEEKYEDCKRLYTKMIVELLNKYQV